MDWKEIDRIRVPGFAIARRGYDRHEVDRFLGRLADWLETDAPNEIGQMAVTRKLELVGKSASHILLTTEQESEDMKRRAQQESAQVREEAQSASQQTRQAADEYAKKTRQKADEDARRATDAATAMATKTVEAGDRRREAIETVVTELTERRDEVLRELERLQGELGTTLNKHKGGTRSTKRRTTAPATVPAAPAPAPAAPAAPAAPVAEGEGEGRGYRAPTRAGQARAALDPRAARVGRRAELGGRADVETGQGARDRGAQVLTPAAREQRPGAVGEQQTHAR